MNRIFGTKKSHDYFSDIENSIKHEIQNLKDAELLKTDIDNKAEEIYKAYKIRTPVLEKSKTKTSITKKQLRGEELPSGTRFVLGKLYEVEFANFQLPFSGASSIFACISPPFYDSTAKLSMDEGLIKVELTNWGIVTGNQPAISELRERFVQFIDSIQRALDLFSQEAESFNSGLPEKIKSSLRNKVNAAKSRRESEEGLNPFK